MRLRATDTKAHDKQSVDDFLIGKTLHTTDNSNSIADKKVGRKMERYIFFVGVLCP